MYDDFRMPTDDQIEMMRKAYDTSNMQDKPCVLPIFLSHNLSKLGQMTSTQSRIVGKIRTLSSNARTRQIGRQIQSILSENSIHIAQNTIIAIQQSDVKLDDIGVKVLFGNLFEIVSDSLDILCKMLDMTDNMILRDMLLRQLAVSTLCQILYL